jgi:transposase-like protein
MTWSIKNGGERPQTLTEAIRCFSDLDVATEFVARLRWPEGPFCPECGGKNHYYLKARRLWLCRACKKQFSVKVGTLLEGSPLGLDKWLTTIWMIANSKSRVSSYEIQDATGVTQKTAWFMLHRLRLAMQSGTFEKLSGKVAVDESFNGGQNRNAHTTSLRRR